MNINYFYVSVTLRQICTLLVEVEHHEHSQRAKQAGPAAVVEEPTRYAFPRVKLDRAGKHGKRPPSSEYRADRGADLAKDHQASYECKENKQNRRSLEKVSSTFPVRVHPDRSIPGDSSPHPLSSAS